MSRYVELARIYTAAMKVDSAFAPVVAEMLEVCDLLGQLRTFPGGFAAWLRCEPEHLHAFRARDVVAVCSLSHHELTKGSVLYIAEVIALLPGYAAKIVRELSHLPGVRALAAHRKRGTRWKVQRLRAA